MFARASTKIEVDDCSTHDPAVGCGGRMDMLLVQVSAAPIPDADIAIDVLGMTNTAPFIAEQSIEAVAPSLKGPALLIVRIAPFVPVVLVNAEL